VKRRRERVTYEYECTMTGEKYVRTEKAPNPKDLVSVKAYYELNADKDDRPAIVKKRLGVLKEETKH
jgi:hypothetical protein